MTQRLIVFLMVGGVAGFGAVFLELPGLVLGLVIVAILVGTNRRSQDWIRVGAYLMGFGLVGWSLVGPAVKGGGGFLFLNGWLLVAVYAVIAVAGCALVGWLALVELRNSRNHPN
jgi:hypothetical protein